MEGEYERQKDKDPSSRCDGGARAILKPGRPEQAGTRLSSTHWMVGFNLISPLPKKESVLVGFEFCFVATFSEA